MGRKGRRGKSKSASVSGGHPEENTGSHPVKELDPAAAAPATGRLLEKDVDPAAAAAATGSNPEKNLVPDKLPSRNPVADAYWRKRGCPVLSQSRRAEIEEENCRMLNTLIDKLKISDNKLFEKERTRDAIKCQIYELERYTNQPRAEDYIIAFVKEMVRENEFLEFQDYLKQRNDVIQHNGNTLDIFKILVQKERVHKNYKELNFEDIVNAINGCIVDLKIEQHRKERELKATNENISTSPEEDNKWFSLDLALLKDGYKGPSFNPIGDLVKAIRLKGYIMDKEALKELRKIEDKNPVFYFNHFCRKVTMKYSENQVQVSHVPLDYDEEQVKAAFSVCGEIVDVKLERGGSWSKIAYVTFKESEGAKIAPFLMDRASFSILPIDVPHNYTENNRTRLEFRNALRRYEQFRSGNFSRTMFY